jgi:hypothetical protein
MGAKIRRNEISTNIKIISSTHLYSGGMHPVARVMKSQDKSPFATSIVRASLHVSAYITSHPQVITIQYKIFKKKLSFILGLCILLKEGIIIYSLRSYHVIATDPLSRY